MTDIMAKHFSTPSNKPTTHRNKILSYLFSWYLQPKVFTTIHIPAISLSHNNNRPYLLLVLLLHTPSKGAGNIDPIRYQTIAFLYFATEMAYLAFIHIVSLDRLVKYLAYFQLINSDGLLRSLTRHMSS